MKYCGHCRRLKPLDDFCRSSATPDGRQPWCKRCKAEHLAELRRKDPQRVKEHERTTLANIRNDPERLATRRDQNREWFRRAHGITPNRYRHRPDGDVARGSVPAGPFASWLHRALRRYESTDEIAWLVDPDNYKSLGRRLRAARQQETIPVDVVDRVLLTIEGPDGFSRLYPDFGLATTGEAS